MIQRRTPFTRLTPKVYRTGLIALAASLAGLLGGCLGGDDKSEGRSYTTEVADIDRENKTIATRDIYSFCDGNEIVTDTFVTEERYLIESGALYHWEPGYSCMANRSTGSSADIVGTWTANPPTLEDAPVNDDSYCDEVAQSDREELNLILRRAKIVEKITETKITTTVLGEVCWAEQWGWLLITNSGMDGDIEITERGCSSATLENADGETAQVTAREVGDAIAVKVTIGGTTCEVQLKDDSGPASCSETGDPQAVLEACAYGTGFFGDAPIWKKGQESAPRRSAHNLMRRTVRGL